MLLLGILETTGSEALGYAVVAGDGADGRVAGDVRAVSSVGGGHVEHAVVLVG